jgi:putative transposase
MDIKKMFTRLLPDWTKDTPFQVKGMAIKDAHNAFWKTCKANFAFFNLSVPKKLIS